MVYWLEYSVPVLKAMLDWMCILEMNWQWFKFGTRRKPLAKRSNMFGMSAKAVPIWALFSMNVQFSNIRLFNSILDSLWSEKKYTPPPIAAQFLEKFTLIKWNVLCDNFCLLSVLKLKWTPPPLPVWLSELLAQPLALNESLTATVILPALSFLPPWTSTERPPPKNPLFSRKMHSENTTLMFVKGVFWNARNTPPPRPYPLIDVPTSLV